MDPSCTLGFYCRDRADFEMFCAQVSRTILPCLHFSNEYFQWNHICHMATDDRRTCPIFRIERGTFQESHTRALNCDYPSINDDENVILRVTKLSTSGSHSLLSSLSSSNHSQSNKKSQSAMRDIYDDPSSQYFHENSSKKTRTRKHSLSDDYVFL